MNRERRLLKLRWPVWLMVDVAARGTVWYCNHPETVGRWRRDQLVGVFRVYSRSYGCYLWRLVIGRLAVTVVRDVT